METLEDAFEYDHALVFGIGGSGDIVGSIPTARLLERHGVETTLGGIAWEPAPRDPVVGPRRFDEIENLEPLSDTVGLATGETRIRDGIPFAETHIAAHYGEPVVLIDITHGADGMISGLEEACATTGIDVIIGTDSGGDALARGDEPGLRSPVSDALGLATLDEIDVPSCLGVFGYGSDGELTIDELEAGIARAAERGGFLGSWGLTRRVVKELQPILDAVSTEASRLPVEAAQGDIGERTIRGGEVSLTLTPSSTVTFYFEPSAVTATSELVSHVHGKPDLDAVRESFSRAGFVTEFDLERARLESQ